MLWLWVLLVATSFAPPSSLAYDGHNQIIIDHDNSVESTFRYDAVLVLTTSTKENGKAGDRVFLAKFPKSVAAESEVAGIGGAPRDCIACVAEHLAASAGMEAPEVEALRAILEKQNVTSWQDAVKMIQEATGLKAGTPVVWEAAAPGEYAVFVDGHVVYGYLPPASPNLGSYVFDRQLVGVDR